MNVLSTLQIDRRLRPLWLPVFVALLLGVCATTSVAQEVRTQELHLDDSAPTSASRNTITLQSPVDLNLTSNYSLRLPSTNNLAAGSMLYVSNYTAPTATLGWTAPGSEGDILTIVGGIPVWNATSGLSEWLDGSTIGIGGIIYAKQALQNGATDTVVITDDGRFALGTTSPDADMTIRGSGTLFNAKDAGGTLRSALSDNGSHAWYLSTGTGEAGQANITTISSYPAFSLFTTGTTNRFDFVNRGTFFAIGYDADGGSTGTVMSIEQGGNVGIGVADAQNRLHVVATSDPLRLGGLSYSASMDTVLVTDVTGVVRKRAASTLLSSTGTAWLLLGNAGTNPATNFVGTTDAQSLVFRTSNIERMRLGTSYNLQGGGTGTTATGTGSFAWGQNNSASGQLATISGGSGNSAAGQYAFVGGGLSNSATVQLATVTGGSGNQAQGQYSFVGAGQNNSATTQHASVVGGSGNQAQGQYAFVGNGQNNSATTQFSAIISGLSNTASGQYAVIGGGQTNSATTIHTFIGGGVNNSAGGQAAVVGGGSGNSGSGQYAALVGGSANAVTGGSAALVGGTSNAATGGNAFVGGGQSNVGSGSHSVVGGGQSNVASFQHATIGGGWSNTASNTQATIGGGQGNTASAQHATIGGGWTNRASGSQSTVGGGQGNLASGIHSTVAGGHNDTAAGQYGFVGGGYANYAGGSSVTAGGFGNRSTGNTSSILGGMQNTATAQWSTVGGGAGNDATGQKATIGGGNDNTASGENSTVSGGYNNTASAVGATISGGVSNTAVGTNGTVGGGAGNQAGQSGTVAGGGSNTATGLGATAGGGANHLVTGQYAVTAGGYHNWTLAQYGATGGGRENSNNGSWGVIAGGDSNRLYDNNNYGVIGGGRVNLVGADYGVIAGGYRDSIWGAYSSIGGGDRNYISGSYSAIPGGRDLTLGANSFGFNGSNSGTRVTLSSTNNIAYLGNVNLMIGNIDNTARELRFYEPNASASYTGTNFTGFKAQAQAGDVTYTLPAADGTTGQVLTTNGSALLSWSNPQVGFALIGGSIFVIKENDESVTNSTTLQNDDDLFFTLNANETYEVNALLYGQCTSPNRDVKIAFTLPTGATMKLSYLSHDEGNNAQGSGLLVTSGAAGGKVDINAADITTIFLQGLITMGSTGGTVRLQWTQYANGTEATVIQKDSYIRVTRAE